MSTNSAPPPFPKLVMIIRHGEKPGAPETDDDTPSPDLSIRGSARAAALPSLFTPDPTGSGTSAQQLSCAVSVGNSLQYGATYQSAAGIKMPAPRFPTPQHIVATATSNNSNRPVETVTPTAQALALEIDMKRKDSDHQKAADDVLKDYGGDFVLVCWHHGNIPKLALAFGVPQAQIDKALSGDKKWPGEVFDWIWSIDWDGGSANLTGGFQYLLSNDNPPS